MPWWAVAYFVFFVTFSLWSLQDDLKTGQSTWHLTMEAACDVLLVGAALSYWLHEIRSLIESILLCSFSIGAATLALLQLRAFQRHALDRNLPTRGKVVVAISGLGLSALVGGPLLYWGFESAVLHRYAGT